jgi:hypothetical protein
MSVIRLLSNACGHVAVIAEGPRLTRKATWGRPLQRNPELAPAASPCYF